MEKRSNRILGKWKYITIKEIGISITIELDEKEKFKIKFPNNPRRNLTNELQKQKDLTNSQGNNNDASSKAKDDQASNETYSETQIDANIMNEFNLFDNQDLPSSFDDFEDDLFDGNSSFDF